jgi:hypothetical protein
MTKHLSGPTRRSMRKDLVRLRMEMHRQQLKYHAQPLAHPLRQIKELVSSDGATRSSRKTPFALGATLFLALFGKRLGVVGKLARLGLAVYPIVRGVQAASKAVKDEDTHETRFSEFHESVVRR